MVSLRRFWRIRTTFSTTVPGKKWLFVIGKLWLVNFELKFIKSFKRFLGFPVVLYVIPLFIALVVHIKIIVKTKKLMKKPSFKPNMAYQSDFSLVRCNFFSYLTFVTFWFPFGIVILISSLTSPQNISDKTYYYSV